MMILKAGLMKKGLFFAVLAAMFLTPWPVAYAFGNTTAGDTPVEVVPAAAEAAPQMNTFGMAIGGVTAGDLFYLDTTEAAEDVPVTLYLTNTDELASRYRYMTLNIGVYVQTAPDVWQKAVTGDTYLTMHNGMTSFTLPGYGRYKVTIDRGCFYNFGNSTGGEAVRPSFYLSAG